MTWEASLPGGGVSDLSLTEDRRLAGAGAGGLAAVWDMQTRHKTLGYTRYNVTIGYSDLVTIFIFSGPT